MQKNKIYLAKKCLALLEKKSWNSISYSMVVGNEENIQLKNKNELLININRYFDFLMRDNLSNLEKSSTKDMLFEVLMARLDILNIYRKSVKNLIKFIFSNPQKSIKLLPSFIETIILIATLSNIDVNGIKGAFKVKAIFLLYIVIIYTWNMDETNSLEKTMTTLDKYLSNIEKFINLK